MTSMTRRIALVVAVIGLVAGAPGPVEAQFVVDQQQTAVSQGNGISFVNAIQTFTPGLDSLNYVELNLWDSYSGDGVGGSFYVNVLQGGNQGAVIGTSETTVLANGINGVAGFDFSSPVSLVSGGTYALELVSVSSQFFYLMANVSTIDAYTGGLLTSSQGGTYAEPYHGDMYFREGIKTTGVVPEPASIAMAGTSVIVGLGLAWRRKRAAA